MHFNGEGKAESYLMYIDYHRLSAYIFHSTKSIKTTWFYKTVHAFEQVMALYRFDKKLRIMLFNEIEKIEVAIRSVQANIGCQKLGYKYWITKAEYFGNAEKFKQTLAVIENELESNKEEYIENFRHNYIEDYAPTWKITEVLSFGNYIYYNMVSNRQRKLIADYFRLKPQVYIVVDLLCQPAQYVLLLCQGVKQGFYARHLQRNV